MFVKESVQGSAIWNGLIFAALTAAVVIGVLAMTKFKPSGDADGSLKATLAKS